jgi:hypothetical protein
LTLEAEKRLRNDPTKWSVGDRISWDAHKLVLNNWAEDEKQGNDRKNNGERLDCFVRKLVKQYVPQSAVPATDLEHARKVVHDIAAEINCEVCVKEANARTSEPDLRPCHGHRINDHAVVALAGHCIYPIHNANDEALQLAQQLYGRATGIKEIDTHLVTTLGVPEALTGHTITATGELHWRDVPGRRRVKVLVTVNAAQFEERGLDLLPYCLTHEFVCHAFQRAAMTGERPEDVQDYDALAEGWMDYVVMELLGREGERAAGHQAHFIHMLRRDSECFAHSGLVAIGAEAAEAVLRVFDQQGQPSGLRNSPWQDFVDFSCQLNAHPWDPMERLSALSELPDRLGRVQQRSGLLEKLRGPKQSKVEKDLVDVLLKWRSSRGEQPWMVPLKEVLDELCAPLTKA